MSEEIKVSIADLNVTNAPNRLIGGNKGRILILNTDSGSVQIRTIGLGIKEI